MKLRPLPTQTEALCRAVNAPPRLVAHLTLVHDVACGLVAELQNRLPELSFDSEAVLYGASWHDIGKAVYPAELAASGKAHEAEGERLLLRFGLSPDLARFARTHGAWRSDKSLLVEDLLVALADTCWKGARLGELEDWATQQIAAATGRASWAVYLVLDEILQDLAANADARLAWQAQFPAELPCG